jgi:broad specificity phosphatase PhoE
VTAIYLIRHGQASYGAAEYDRLSPIGVRQSGQLGAWWAGQGQAFDAVYTGPRSRQIDTARHMIDAGRAGGAAWPEPIQLEELDEFPAFELLRYWVPVLQAESDEFRTLMASQASQGERAAILDAGFRFVVGKWFRGELDVEHLESFARFRDRVERAMAKISDAHPMPRGDSGRERPRIAVVTSGGPITVAMRLALGLDHEATMRVIWVVHNASFSEFRGPREPPGGATAGDAARHPLTMHSFNAVPHLVDRDLLTYR